LLSELWTASDNPASQFGDTVNLREALTAAAATLQTELAARNLTLENLIPADLPPIHADQHKIQRLFGLLLQDELVSLPAGSRVVVRAEATHAAGKPGVNIKLADNGPGLPQESLRTLFDPFMVRGDSPGEFGINLMACFFIVYHHGGIISAESKEGQGTTFTLQLPLQPDRSAPLADDQDFLQKAVMNEELWRKLISS